MISPIIQYISFSTSEDFVQWQEDNRSYGVITVTPIVSGIDVYAKDGSGANAQTSITVFVTYTTV